MKHALVEKCLDDFGEPQCCGPVLKLSGRLLPSWPSLTRPPGLPAGYRETVGEDALYDAFDEYLRQRNQTAAKVAVTDGAALVAARRSTLFGCTVH